MSERGATFWEFDGFRLEAGEGGRLWKGDLQIHLKPKAVEVLRLLVEARGAIVTRAEILESAWPDAFVEEGNINYTISCIRKKLRKHGSEGTKFIGTVPKTGYRFLPDVVEVIESSADPVFRAAEPHTFWTRSRFVLFAMMVVVLTTSFGIWWRTDRASGLSSVSVSDRNIASLVVLPPMPLSKDVDDPLLRMAIADSVSSSIAKLNAIAVRPVSGVLAFERSGKDELEFAQGLNADAVLASTYLKEDDTVRLNFRLLDARDGAVVWSDKLDLSDSGLLEIQESVSKIVTARLIAALRIDTSTVDEAVLTTDPEAYELYLRGKYFLIAREHRKSEPLDLFRRAVELDPQFAEAYVGIADSLAFQEEPGDELRDSLEKAIELDPTLAGAFATRGFVRMFNEWDWAGAEEDLRHAIDLDPNNWKARQWFGTYLTLRGEFEQAREQLKIALQLDPSSRFIRSDLAELLYFEGRFLEAEEAARQLLALDPNYDPAYRLLEKISFKRGDHNAAMENSLKFFSSDLRLQRELSGDAGSESLSEFASAFLRAMDCYDRKKMVGLPCAEMMVLAGKDEDAKEYLKRAADLEMFLLPFVAVDPLWDKFREDIEFTDVLDRIGLNARSEPFARK